MGSKDSERCYYGINEALIKKVGLVPNLVNVSMSLKFHVIFDDMLYTGVTIKATDPEVWIRLVH